jgi:hypothetical protein
MNKSFNVVVLVAVAAGCMFASSLLRAQASGESGVVDTSELGIHVEMEIASETQVILKVSEKNVGTSPIWVVTDTERVNRSKGPYLDIESSDPDKLICSFQFYPPSPFEFFVNGTSVHLMRLVAGESHEETLKLSWPIRTTLPPFSNTLQTRVITAKSIKRIEVRIGFLPESPSLLDLINRKSPPHDRFTGLEQIKVGSSEKSLYEIQDVARSSLMEITKPLTGEDARGPSMHVSARSESYDNRDAMNIPNTNTLAHESSHLDSPKPK